MSQKILSAYKTDRGQVAEINEDFIWVNEAQSIFIIADGMGGHESGEVASRLAAETVGNAICAGLDSAFADDAMERLLLDSIEQANSAVWQASGKAGQKRRMGATIVVAVISPPAVFIAHAGDARIYRLRGENFLQLTEDDSWVAHLAAAGLITEDEKKNNRLSHVITKAIGQESEVEASFSAVFVQPGDWVLLCSDGLWNMVSDDRIFQEVDRSPEDALGIVNRLVQTANDAGGDDNISVIVVKIL